MRGDAGRREWVGQDSNLRRSHSWVAGLQPVSFALLDAHGGVACGLRYAVNVLSDGGHRMTVLHTWACLAAGAPALSNASTIRRRRGRSKRQYARSALSWAHSR